MLYLAAMCYQLEFRLSRVDKPLYNYDKSIENSITSGKFTKDKFKAYRTFQAELQKYCRSLTFQQLTNSIGDLALKTFLYDALSPTEFYREFKGERKYLKAMHAPRNLKLLIVASSYGLYMPCQLFFKLYSWIRR